MFDDYGPFTDDPRGQDDFDDLARLYPLDVEFMDTNDGEPAIVIYTRFPEIEERFRFTRLLQLANSGHWFKGGTLYLAPLPKQPTCECEFTDSGLRTDVCACCLAVAS